MNVPFIEEITILDRYQWMQPVLVQPACEAADFISDMFVWPVVTDPTSVTNPAEGDHPPARFLTDTKATAISAAAWHISSG